MFPKAPVDARCSLYISRKLLGYSYVKTTQIYSKITDCMKTDAVNLVDSISD